MRQGDTPEIPDNCKMDGPVSIFALVQLRVDLFDNSAWPYSYA